MALTTRKWTRTEFEKLSQAGVVPEHERLEPIEGEIVPLTPIDPRHDHTVDCLAMKLVKLFGDDYVVRVQNPVVVGERSEPQPDLVMFPQTYAELLRAESRHPEKASLIVEVSNSSLKKALAPLHRKKEAVSAERPQPNSDRRSRSRLAH